jgi:hypothetical protein
VGSVVKVEASKVRTLRSSVKGILLKFDWCDAFYS